MRVIFGLCVLSLGLYCQAVCPFSGADGNELDTATGCPHSAIAAVKAESTFQGCKCKSQCGASPEHGLSNCDWCRTEGNCGTLGLRGRYDNCKYAADAAYEAQPWDSKINHLWSKVDANHTSGPLPSPLGIFLASVQTSFNAVRDEMPEGRTKFIHSVGAVCRFNMTIDKHSPYSGLFEARERTHGLIRMGSAAKVDLKSGVIPGVGVKFLRSGVKSGNYVALWSVDKMPDNEYNFFAKALSSHIPPAGGIPQKLVAKKFQQASGCVTQVGLSGICTHNTAGQRSKKLSFPFQVSMVPGKTVSTPSTPVTQATMQRSLASIPSGTVLYTIMHRSAPGAEQQVLGEMVTNGACVNSLYGDTKLFFQHQRIEEDWQINEDWLPTDPQAVCGADHVSLTPPAICKKAGII